MHYSSLCTTGTTATSHIILQHLLVVEKLSRNYTENLNVTFSTLRDKIKQIKKNLKSDFWSFQDFEICNTQRQQQYASYTLRQETLDFVYQTNYSNLCTLHILNRSQLNIDSNLRIYILSLILIRDDVSVAYITLFLADQELRKVSKVQKVNKTNQNTIEY